MTVELIRGRFHPDLHPVLRVVFDGPSCRAESPYFYDEEWGEEVCHSCSRPSGHTGRHMDWSWRGREQEVHVWPDRGAR